MMLKATKQQMNILFAPGICPEPGGVPFSTRTEYNGPYNVGDQVTYSCVQGGVGGTITCHTNRGWGLRPACSGT